MKLPRLQNLAEGKNEDHADWQKGYDYAKYLRKSNKEAGPNEIKNMSAAFAQGYRKGIKD